MPKHFPALTQDNTPRRGNIHGTTNTFRGDPYHPPQRPDFGQTRGPAIIVANGVRRVPGTATASQTISQSTDSELPDPLPRRPTPFGDPKSHDQSKPAASTTTSRQAQRDPARATRDKAKTTPHESSCAGTTSSTNSSTQSRGTKRSFHATVESNDEAEGDQERSDKRRPRRHTLGRSCMRNTQSESSGEEAAPSQGRAYEEFGLNSPEDRSHAKSSASDKNSHF